MIKYECYDYTLLQLLAYHDQVTMTVDQYFSFCHNLQHFLINFVSLYDFLLLLSIFLLLITVAVLVQEFAFFQTRLIFLNLYNIVL